MIYFGLFVKLKLEVRRVHPAAAGGGECMSGSSWKDGVRGRPGQAGVWTGGRGAACQTKGHVGRERGERKEKKTH